MALVLVTICDCGAAIRYTDTRYRPRTCEPCKDAHERAYQARRRAAAIRPSVRAAVIARDGYRCTYCGIAVRHRRHRGDIRPDTIELDHIVPVLLGGDSTLANLVVSCMGCNRKKGSSMESIESPYYASLTAGRAALDALDRGRESLFGSVG